jgi:3-oxoacyl-[acyl-carrier-protein] synthase-3
MYRAQILGTGSYLPKNIVTNHDLEKTLDTSHDWIVQRTGIHQRHIAQTDERTSDMGTKAALQALEMAGISIDQLDFIICATTTPDRTFPATAAKIQANLCLRKGFAFDIQAACSGFVYALSVANNFIQQGQARHGLVIGAEKMSSIVDWSDRATAILFGDGAGAVVLKAVKSEGSDKDQGILGSYLHSDGSLEDILYTDGGPSFSESVGKIKMNGREVYKHAVLKMGAALEEVLETHHLTSEDIDWFVPHQANERIIDALAERLKFPQEKIIKTGSLQANTSAATIPLALDAGVREGKIKPGQLVLIDALGAGLVWGAALIRF